jgi:hypothetical protein
VCVVLLAVLLANSAEPPAVGGDGLIGVSKPGRLPFSGDGPRGSGVAAG